jgi:MFS superfamily sulfate permease-like transporter
MHFDESSRLLPTSSDQEAPELARSLDRTSNWLHGPRKGNQHEDSKLSRWDVVSPMTTAHICRTHLSPPRMKRVRSRSFNDFIHHRQQGSSPAQIAGQLQLHQKDLFLPPLRAPTMIPVQDPQNFYQSTATDAAKTDNNGKQATLQIQQQSTVSETSYYDHQHDDTMTADMHNRPIEKAEPSDGNPIWICVLYGIINATIVLPVLMSFGSIIYRNDAFDPYMPVLIKMTLASGVVHQICFSSLSSLPFAVGQVQDAGLIFLSSMAKDTVEYCQSRGYDDETMLATVTVGLATCTAILGLGLILIGKLKLAGYVQMLPTCVVGGYLAFIGWFCGVSGISLMAGGTGDINIFIVFDRLTFILPGILGGIFIYCSVRTLRHVAVLPMCIIFLLIIFYGVLVATETSVEDATEIGWIRKSQEAPVWYLTWEFLKLNKVDWGALPGLLLTELSMIFVVALSSSLDVAAIELEMQQPLDYNQELTMVGISNMVSGLTGGYTGSYIFSQSIFSLRAGIRSRLAGFVLAACEILVFVIPFPILSYVPNFFYGSLLSMICIDLMYEWLWDIRNKVTIAEYIIGLATFVLIQIIGVEYGILAGVIIYLICYRIGVNVGEVKFGSTNDDTEEYDTTSQEAEEKLSNGLH